MDWLAAALVFSARKAGSKVHLSAAKGANESLFAAGGVSKECV